MSMDFLQNLDKDLQKALITQLRNLWTHTSTAIEGNTLTLGETAFVLEEGLTISGKPLKDHEEVVDTPGPLIWSMACWTRERLLMKRHCSTFTKRFRPI